MSYKDSQVAVIIERYVDLMRARDSYFRDIWCKKVDSSRRIKAIKNVEEAMAELKKVISPKLGDMLPEINLKGLEELCEEVTRK